MDVLCRVEIVGGNCGDIGERALGGVPVVDRRLYVVKNGGLVDPENAVGGDFGAVVGWEGPYDFKNYVVAVGGFRVPGLPRWQLGLVP